MSGKLVSRVGNLQSEQRHIQSYCISENLASSLSILAHVKLAGQWVCNFLKIASLPKNEIYSSSKSSPLLARPRKCRHQSSNRSRMTSSAGGENHNASEGGQLVITDQGEQGVRTQKATSNQSLVLINSLLLRDGRQPEQAFHPPWIPRLHNPSRLRRDKSSLVLVPLVKNGRVRTLNPS